MSKETKNNKSYKNGKGIKSRKFRMAYSVNNWQPVECTLISDQPFFYMDDVCDLEDDGILTDDFLEDHDMISDGVLLSEIAQMKEKIEAYERLSDTHKKNNDHCLKEFKTDSENFSSTNKRTSNSLESIEKVLLKSRMGHELLKFAHSKNIVIEVTKQSDTAHYDKSAGKIFIRSDLVITDQVLLLVQELRRFWQDAHGAMLDPLSLHPDQAILANRAQKADLAVTVIRCAWEMKLQGESAIWSRIENSSLADLGRALAREALTDFRTLNNGRALSAVFETWFLSERCRYEDKTLIQAMLADYRGYIYDNTEASQKISIDLICKLGEQPFGKNYLASYAQMILSDSLFTEVRDRSNANFLWFIKFERTFKETEQELQSSQPIKMAGVDQSENKNIFEDNQNETGLENSATQRHPEQVAGGAKPSTRSNVIAVQFGHKREILQELHT